MVTDCLKASRFEIEVRYKSKKDSEQAAYTIIDGDPRVNGAYIYIHEIKRQGCFVVKLKRVDLTHIPVIVQHVHVAVDQELYPNVSFDQNGEDYKPTEISIPFSGTLLQSPGLTTESPLFGDLGKKYAHIVFIIALVAEEYPENVLLFKDEIFARVRRAGKMPVRWFFRQCVTKWRGLPAELRNAIECVPICGKKGLETLGALMGLPSGLRCSIKDD